MINLIPNMDSGTRKTPTCKSQQRQIGIAMRKVAHDEIKISHGHFYSSGFLRRDDVIVYFSTGDFRYFNNTGIVRYANSFTDYTGGQNIHTTLEKLDCQVENLFPHSKSEYINA